MDVAQSSSEEVLRLSLGESQPVLNVLSRGLDGESLSVECPFPVLRLEVPVNVTLPGGENQAPVKAMIEKIGVVEGESGIPRFKLQISLDSGEQKEAMDDLQMEIDFSEDAPEEPMVASAEEQDEASTAEEQDEVATAEEQDEASTVETEEVVELAELFSDDDDEPFSDEEEEVEVEDEWTSKAHEHQELSWPDTALDHDEVEDNFAHMAPTMEGPADFDDDPPWAAEDFEAHDDDDDDEDEDTGDHLIPPPKSRWPVRATVALAFVFSVAAVGYVMREQINAWVEPFVGEQGISLAALGFETPAAPPAAEPEEMGHIAAAEPAATPALASEEPATAPTETEAAVATAEESPAPEEAADTEGEAPLLADAQVQDADGSVRVMLPTQWPVSEARSYRLHDPTGIVVDIPGGLASNAARWIDTSHDRVRSVRVLERDNGVRFIIYLNDERVPRYRVGYGRTGVTVDILGPDPRHVVSK